VRRGGYILLSLFARETLGDMLFYKISGEKILDVQHEITPDICDIAISLAAAGFKLTERVDVHVEVKYGDSRLANLITSAGALAWQILRDKLPTKEYSKLVQCALLRLEAETKTNPTLSDIEHRTMLLAKFVD
jgi:hypothetical protein